MSEASPLRPAAPTASAAAVLSALLEARTGQRIGGDRMWRIETALQPLLRERGAATTDELVMALLGGGDPSLGDRIVEAVLNNETSFFREPVVFASIVDALATQAAAGRRLRVWSAGCSTGQEPLSLAMALTERFEGTGHAMPEIVATDVSDMALSRAREGLYTQFEIQRGLATRQMLRWFTARADGQWLAAPALLRAVQYRRLNLARLPWPVGSFDVILCRNVLLYLVPGVKKTIFDGFAAALRPGGLLILGAGETVLGQTDVFEPSRRVRGAYHAIGGERAAA